MTDKVQKILNEIQTRKLCTMDEHMAFYSKEAEADYRLLFEIEEYIKSMQEEPVSDDLEETINTIKLLTSNTALLTFENGFRKGVKWQEKKDQDAVEIARKEVIDKLRKWIANKNKRDSFTFGYIDRHFDELLKQAMKDE